jgi:hypothetical protein
LRPDAKIPTDTAADLDTARRLGIEPDAPIMATRYTFRADGEPIQVSWSREPLVHVQAIERTYYAQGRPVETADIVFPVGRYEIVYRFPVD